MHTIPCNNWSALASRSPESEFETGYVLQDGIFNCSLVRKREKLGNCPVWKRGGDRVRQRQGEREREGVVTDCRTNPHSSRLLELL